MSVASPCSGAGYAKALHLWWLGLAPFEQRTWASSDTQSQTEGLLAPATVHGGGTHGRQSRLPHNTPCNAGRVRAQEGHLCPPKVADHTLDTFIKASMSPGGCQGPKLPGSGSGTFQRDKTRVTIQPFTLKSPFHPWASHQESHS